MVTKWPVRYYPAKALLRKPRAYALRKPRVRISKKCYTPAMEWLADVDWEDVTPHDLYKSSEECDNEIWNWDRRYAVKGIAGAKPVSLEKIERPYKQISQRCNDLIMALLRSIQSKDPPAHYESIPNWDGLYSIKKGCSYELHNYLVEAEG